MIHQKDGGRVGKTISHYRITEKLGEGGMGIVYKGEDIKLRRTVALKFLHPYLIRDQEAKERFIQEAQAASALDHLNICTVHEINETEDEHLFIVMTYYDGETLKEKIKREQLRLNQVMDIAVQIASGLARAHEAGIIHRDIKSSNTIITERNEVKIIDFGLAKLSGQTGISKKGSTMGTAAYMSPEQAQGLNLDHQTDIWSFGVILYEMLTGELPFDDEFDQVVLFKIVNQNPTPITDLNTGIPIELAEITNKAMAKKLNERYQHVDEILDDLKILKKRTEKSGEIQPLKVVKGKSSNKRYNKILLPTGIVVFLVIGFFLLRFIIFDKAQDTAPTPIAVISFTNQTGDKSYDYLREAIPNLLITSLEQSPYLQVTTWQRMRDLLKQMGNKDVEIIDESLGFELCGMDGVNLIVLGSITKIGDMFATDVKVLDVRTKKLLTSASSKGEGINSILQNQIDELGREINRSIGVSEQDFRKNQREIMEVTTSSMEAYNYFLRGKNDSYKLYYSDAARFLEKAVQLDSTFAMAYARLAWNYRKLGYMNKCGEMLKKAMKLSHKATKKERLQIEASYVLHFEGVSARWFNLLTEYETKYPMEKDAYSYLGLYYTYKGKEYEAVDYFLKALELDPYYAFTYRELGLTYARIGEFKKALKCAEKYATISPGDADPFDTLGEIYFRMGKLDDAIAKYKEAIEVKPDFFRSLRKLSYACALNEDYEQAIKWINKYISMGVSLAKKVQGYDWRGWCYYMQGNFLQFNRDFHKAMVLLQEVWQDSALAISFIGLSKVWFYYDYGELEAGKNNYQRWIDHILKSGSEYKKLTSKVKWLLYQGFLDLRSGQIDSANARLAEAKLLIADVKPSFGYQVYQYQYHLLHAEILLAQDSLQQAIAIGKNPPTVKLRYVHIGQLTHYNYPLEKDVLARAYRKKGALNKAISEYERLITIDPKDTDRRLIYPKYHYRLAKLYEEKGRLGKAQKEYEKFLTIWKDANEDLPELIDTKKRLKILKLEK